MDRTKYIIEQIELIEDRMNKRLEMNEPLDKKVNWIRNIVIDLHREDEFSLIKYKMKLPIDDYIQVTWQN